jgi:hypothetical protein
MANTLTQEKPIAASISPDVIADSQPAAAPVLAAVVRSRVTVPFSSVLSMASPVFEFDPCDVGSGTLLSRCAFFESVHIESCTITGHMLAGSSRWLAAAITDREFSADTSVATMLKAPVANFTQGAQYGGTNLTIDLPPSHPFGREIKAVAIGNRPPKFFVKYGGGTANSDNTDVYVRGTVTISWSGTAPVSGI